MPSVARLVTLAASPTSKQFLQDGFASASAGFAFSVSFIDHIEDAAKHMHENQTDIVLLDTDGNIAAAVEDLMGLRREWRVDQLPIIVMTRTTSCDDILQLLQAGASDFVLKPLTPQTVVARVQAAMGIRENLARLLESERQRVMSDSLGRALATTAAALGGMVDQLEGVMQHAAGDSVQLETLLNGVFERTEHAVAVIERIRQIATLQSVPYAARKHLLDDMTILKC